MKKRLTLVDATKNKEKKDINAVNGIAAELEKKNNINKEYHNTIIKEKATFYFSANMVEELDDIIHKLKKQLKSKKTKINKSVLLELMFRIVKEEYETDPGNNKLIEKIIEL